MTDYMTATFSFMDETGAVKDRLTIPAQNLAYESLLTHISEEQARGGNLNELVFYTYRKFETRPDNTHRVHTNAEQHGVGEYDLNFTPADATLKIEHTDRVKPLYEARLKDVDWGKVLVMLKQKERLLLQDKGGYTLASLPVTSREYYPFIFEATAGQVVKDAQYRLQEGGIGATIVPSMSNDPNRVVVRGVKAEVYTDIDTGDLYLVRPIEPSQFVFVAQPSALAMHRSANTAHNAVAWSAMIEVQRKMLNW